MNAAQSSMWSRLGSLAVLAVLTVSLSACLGLPQYGAKPTASGPLAAVEDPQRVDPTATPTALPLKQDEPTPVPATPTITSTPAGIPKLLADFPLFEGARVNPLGGYGVGEDGAGMLINTSRSPGDLDVFYRKALDEAGWTLRYAEGNRVGGFLQEWRKERNFLTLEYHFVDQQPAVHIDLRVIDSQRALAVLLGFPLPNGTLVTNADGPSLELYVPEDIVSANRYFLDQFYAYRWKVVDTKVGDRCGSRTCQEWMRDEYRSLVTPEPLPTADWREAKAYLVTLPNRVQAKITLLPHRENTRAFVDVNWKNPTRFWMPIPVYPNGEIQSVMPYVLMFTTADDMQTVIKHYKNGMAGLGWTVDRNAIFINEPKEYNNTWTKYDQFINVTLSSSHGKTYGTVTCRGCWQQFVPPTATPTAISE